MGDHICSERKHIIWYLTNIVYISDIIACEQALRGIRGWGGRVGRGEAPPPERPEKRKLYAVIHRLNLYRVVKVIGSS